MSKYIAKGHCQATAQSCTVLRSFITVVLTNGTLVPTPQRGRGTTRMNVAPVASMKGM